MAKGGKKSGGKDSHFDESRTIENRKARHDYEIIETLEVGMVLWGSEVKSIRDGKVSLGEGYVRVEDGLRRVGTGPKGPDGGAKAKARPRYAEPGMWLHSVNIAEYPPAGPKGAVGQHHPTRTRQLLCHKRELAKLCREVQAEGVTIVPLKLYFKNGVAKLLVGLARGRTRGDKREAIAKREMKREMDRAMTKRR
jgi:SsrA-binding protein